MRTTNLKVKEIGCCVGTRQIRTDSNAFQSKIAPVKGAEVVLQLTGFELSEDSSAWALNDRTRDVKVLERAAEEISKAMSNPYFGAF